MTKHKCSKCGQPVEEEDIYRRVAREVVMDRSKSWTYMDILEASSPREVNAASLSRVYQHLESGTSWAVISAWRSEQTPEERNARTDKLKSDLKSIGGYFPMKGKWVETRRDTGEKEVVEEQSFFVIGITRDEISRLTKKYGQEASVFGEEGPDGDILLLGPNGSTIDVLGPNDATSFHPQQVADAYSGLKGDTFVLGNGDSREKGLRSFHFEGLPSTSAEAMMRRGRYEAFQERVEEKM